MKFKAINTKKDFFIFYFSQVFLKRVLSKSSIDPNSKFYIYNFSRIFKVKKGLINQKVIDNDSKTRLLNGRDLIRYKDYSFIYNYFEKIDRQKINHILEITNSKLNNYYKFLTNTLGKSELSQEIIISFIQSPLNKAYTTPDAFTSKILTNRLFLGYDNHISLDNKEKINYYILVIFHEFTHIFINNNLRFQKVLKNIWEKDYKYISASRFRFGLEEILVSALIFPIYGAGIGIPILKYKENQTGRNELIKSRSYFKLLYEFLNKLKSSKSKNKLEKYLPILIKKLVKGGMFANK